VSFELQFSVKQPFVYVLFRWWQDISTRPSWLAVKDGVSKVTIAEMIAAAAEARAQAGNA
jgi:hypothetical protein